MEQAIEQRRDGGGVAEQLPPVFDRSVRGEDRGGPLVAAHDQLEQVLGRGVGRLAHAEVVDDEQGHAGQLGQIVLASLGECRLGELLKERVGFAVDDAVALLDRGAADGLGEMALAGTWRPEQECVLALGDEAGGGELEDEGAVDLLVEGEVEAVERAVGAAEAGRLCRRASGRSWRRWSSSVTSAATRSIGAICSACACCRRVSRTSAMPERRSLRSAWSSSTRFMTGLLFCGR